MVESEAVSEYFRPISGTDNFTFEEKGFNGSSHKDNRGHIMSFQSEPEYRTNEAKPAILPTGANNTGNSAFLSSETVVEQEGEVTHSLPNEEGAATQESENLLESLFRGKSDDMLVNSSHRHNPLCCLCHYIAIGNISSKYLYFTGFEQDSLSMMGSWNKTFR